MPNPLNPLAKSEPQTPCLAMRSREAAAALGVSERTLWTWTHAGTIPHIRHGKTILYPTSVLMQWLNEQASAIATAEGSMKNTTAEGGAE